MDEIIGMFSLVWFSSTKMKEYLKLHSNRNGNRGQANNGVKPPAQGPEAQVEKIETCLRKDVGWGSSKETVCDSVRYTLISNILRKRVFYSKKKKEPEAFQHC